MAVASSIVGHESNDDFLAGMVFSDFVDTSYFCNHGVTLECDVIGFRVGFKDWMKGVKKCPTGVNVVNPEKWAQKNKIQKGQLTAIAEDVFPKKLWVFAAILSFNRQLDFAHQFKFCLHFALVILSFGSNFVLGSILIFKHHFDFWPPF